MTVYVASGYSPQMIPDSATIHTNELDEEEFRFLIHQPYVVSYVGNPAIANLYNVELNKKFLKLDYDDTLIFTVILGGNLDENANCIPANVSLKFKCYQIYRDDNHALEREYAEI